MEGFLAFNFMENLTLDLESGYENLEEKFPVTTLFQQILAALLLSPKEDGQAASPVWGPEWDICFFLALEEQINSNILENGLLNSNVKKFESRYHFLDKRVIPF